MTLVEKGVFGCDKCRRSPKRFFNVNSGKKVKLDSIWVTQADIDELDRRRILPYEHPDKQSYYAGRMGENGKIQEKQGPFG